MNQVRHSLSALLLCALLLLAVPLSPAAHAQEVLDGMAAVVNNEVITFSQVRMLVGPKEKSVRETLKGQALVDKIKEIRTQAVNDLIDRQLILQEYKKMQKTTGANIPDHYVEERVQAIIREEFAGDRAAFTRTLAAQGYTVERFRQEELDKIIVQSMRSQLVKSNGIVPDSKVREFYQQNIANYTSEEQMKLRMVVIKKGEGENRRGMLEEIREKIVGGAEFEDLARMYSEDSTQEQGGDWGWINRRTLNEGLTKLAFNLKPGEVSKIHELSGNYYLLYCEAKKPQTVKPLAEVREEIEKQLAQTERQRAQQEWLEKLRKKAFIKIY